MMRKIILLIFAMLLDFVSFSQVFPEGFEGTFPPSGPAGTWVVAHNGVGIGPANRNLWKQTSLGSTSILPRTGRYAAMVEKMNIGNGKTEEDWLISPLVTVTAKAKLTFYALHGRPGDQGSQLKIKISKTSQTDRSTFTTQLASFSETEIGTMSGVYARQTVDFNGIAPGEKVYIAFVRIHKQEGSGAKWEGDRFVIDDIDIITPCDVPETIQVNNITKTTANVSWGNADNVSEWEIEVIPAASTFTGNGTSTNSNQFTAENLTPGTAYRFRVRSKCAGNNYSNWSDPYQFTTTATTTTTTIPGQTCINPILITTLPYSVTDNTSVYGNHIAGNQGTTGCGTTANYLTGDDVVYAYKATFTGKIDISMKPTATNSGIFVYDKCTNIGVRCLAGIGNSNTDVRNISDFPVTEGITYYFVISTNNSPSKTGYTLEIRAVKETNYCVPPTNLIVANLKLTSADLSWATSSKANEWQIIVQAPAKGKPMITGITVTNLPYNATTTWAGIPLTAGSPYEYYVRAKCLDGTFSTWSGPKSFQLPHPGNMCNMSFVMTDSSGDGWNGNTISIKQNGVEVAKLTGPSVTAGKNPVTVVVPLQEDVLFEIYWNKEGNAPEDVGLKVINSLGAVLYTKPAGTATHGTVLYRAKANCSLPACPEPTALSVKEITDNAVELSWKENGSATKWEIIAVPTGTKFLGSSTCLKTAIKTIVTKNPYTLTGLQAHTQYDIYVKAICGETNISSSSVPGSFTTKTAHDECEGAASVPVNPKNECIVTKPIELSGATISSETETCASQNKGDVWFEFTAIGNAHIIELLNFKGSPVPIVLTLYNGNECGKLKQLYCSSNNSITALGLQPNKVYKIRVAINSTNEKQDVSFDICIKTPVAPLSNSSDCQVNTVNSDFEEPKIELKSGFSQMFNHNTVLGWSTSTTDGSIKFWKAPNTENVPAYSGNQFIALSTKDTPDIYQDFSTPVPTQFTYGFAHRGQKGENSCGLYAGPPGGPYTLVITAKTADKEWKYYTGNYAIPKDQKVTRFIFKAVPGSDVNVAAGSFLDEVRFKANNSVQSPNPLSLNCATMIANVSAVGEGVWLAHKDNPAATVIANPNANQTTITGFTKIGTYKYDWTTLYCKSTLEINFDSNGGGIVPTFNPIKPVCSGGTAPILPARSKEGIKGTWSPATVSNTATGTYTFTPDAGQCVKQTAIATLTVMVQSTFHILSDCVENQVVLEVQASATEFDLNNAHFQWLDKTGITVGNDSPTFNASQYFATSVSRSDLPAEFKVKVISTAGCSLTKSFTVERIFCQIQKGISPNNDGLNDSFDLTGFNVEKLIIYNRYGAEVYSHGAGYAKEWHGQSKNGNELPNGTYFYVIELRKGEAKTGWVYVNREK